MTFAARAASKFLSVIVAPLQLCGPRTGTVPHVHSRFSRRDGLADVSHSATTPASGREIRLGASPGVVSAALAISRRSLKALRHRAAANEAYASLIPRDR